MWQKNFYCFKFNKTFHFVFLQLAINYNQLNLLIYLFFHQTSTIISFSPCLSCFVKPRRPRVKYTRKFCSSTFSSSTPSILLKNHCCIDFNSFSLHTKQKFHLSWLVALYVFVLSLFKIHLSYDNIKKLIHVKWCFHAFFNHSNTRCLWWLSNLSTK